jgi:hypothetical protein
MYELKTSVSPTYAAYPSLTSNEGWQQSKDARETRALRGSIWGIAFVQQPFTKGVGQKTGMLNPQK